MEKKKCDLFFTEVGQSEVDFSLQETTGLQVFQICDNLMDTPPDFNPP